jgi:hypothetical protein
MRSRLTTVKSTSVQQDSFEVPGALSHLRQRQVGEIDVVNVVAHA